MKRRRSVFSALIFFVFLSALAGVNTEAANRASDLPPEALYWTRKLPAVVVGSPALNADSTTLYVATANRRFYGLDTLSGETNWIVRLPATPTSSPVVDDDGSIYVGCANGVLYRISDEDGAGRLDPLFHPFLGGSISTPAVGDDGTVYAGCSANHLYALRPDGSKLWAYDATNNVKTPIIADATIFVVSGGYVRGIGIDDGGEVSSFTPRSAIQSVPALGEDGTLYFGANDDRVYALNSAGTTNEWRFDTKRNVMSSPAIGSDNSIYIASDNLRLYRLNENGVPTVWTNQIATPAPIRSALSIGADGTIYAGADDGRLYAFSADDGHVLWTVKTRAPVRSSAVIDSVGVVYFSSGRVVYAVTNNMTGDVGEPAWQMFRKDRQHTARATLNIVSNGPPTISQQPTNQAVSTGATGSFSVVALSISPLSYQWYFNSNAVASSVNPSATNSTLTITNVTGGNAGFYYVTVMNAFGQATSTVAQLFVGNVLAIVQQPTNRTAVTNTTVNFSVVVAGAGPISYQWRFNAHPIDATANATATNSILTLSNVRTSDAGFYDVVVANSFGMTNSTPALLSVTTNSVPTTNAPPGIAQQPANLNAAEGTSASFSVIATGAPPLFYQWYFNSNAIPASTNSTAANATLSIADVRPANAGFYHVIVTNSVGSATSIVVSLSVAATSGPPAIVQQPSHNSVFVGSHVVFTVGAAGAVPLSYFWRYNSNVIDVASNATATSATLMLPSVKTNDAGFYDVVVTNRLGAVTSAVARLIVIPPLTAAAGLKVFAESDVRIESITIATNGLAIQTTGATDRRVLVLEYKDALNDVDWKPLSTNDIGELRFVDQTAPVDRSRFYRVRAE